MRSAHRFDARTARTRRPKRGTIGGRTDWGGHDDDGRTDRQTDAPIELAERYGAHNYAPLPVVIERGEGAYVWDSDGTRYVDFLSCYSALSHGHRHPRLVAAMKRQLDLVTLTSRAFHNAEMGPFLQELCEYCDTDMALPMNTGAEAVETVLKAARKWAYQVKGVPRYEAEIIVCRRQLPRPHDHRRLALDRGALPRRLRALHPGIQDHPVRRRRGAGSRDHAAHRRLPGRAAAGRERGAPRARGLPARGARAHEGSRRPPDLRRDPDRPRRAPGVASAASTRASSPTSSPSASRSAAASTRSAPPSARARS